MTEVEVVEPIEGRVTPLRKMFLKQNVYDAALERIAWIFDEFDQVIIGWSGGKDSTVTFNLAMQVATEKGRLPLKVLFLDQEAEWDTVIRFTRTIMEREDVEPWWMQIPLRLFNATSPDDPWLKCWSLDDEDKWMRPREDISKKVNRYGTDRFAQLFTAIPGKEWPHQSVAYLAGVRCEESPARTLACTSALTYKHVTWGKVLDKAKGHYTFYPLYDMSYKDIWHAIHSNGWPYCDLYDLMYQQGHNVNSMRVSNLHHETAVSTLWTLQEMEAETWAKLTQRLQGINTTGMMQQDSHRVIKQLPWMFKTWKEYRDHLLENLISDPVVKESMRKTFAQYDEKYAEMKDLKPMRVTQIATVLANDWEFIKLSNWRARPQVDAWRKYMKGVRTPAQKNNAFIVGPTKPYGPRDQPG